MKQLLLILILGITPITADDFIASSPVGEITIKNIPELVVIESELHGKTHRLALGNAIRQCSRYLALIDSPLRYPFLVQFPEWDTQKKTSPAFLQMVLNDHLVLREPKEKGLKVTSTPSATVVSLAYRGGYSIEKWESAVQTLREHLKKINTPASGAPRQVLYSNPDWLPEFFQLAEAQIPIPANYQNP